MDRGDLNANKDAISNTQFAQDWALDSTGNWRNFREDDDGTGWGINQQRTANKVNEITDIAETLGSSWVTPVYNKAGNMTTIPKPADPTTSFYATYDAWNRLVKIEEDDGMSGTWTVADYEYDGAKRCSAKEAYASGVLDETRHFFYTEPSTWQVIEERINSSSDSERQFVWGLRYVDDIVERDRDTDANGTLDERLYGMQDANWNVSGVADNAGAVQERHAYQSYSYPEYFDGDFNPRDSSISLWDRLFEGYVWDRDIEVYLARNRVLDSRGTWVQRDPIGYSSGDPNLYRFERSSPVAYTDPFGQSCDGNAITIGEYRWKKKGAATVYCKNGKLEPVYGQNPDPISPCVAQCIIEHENVHVVQFNKYCPDFCTKDCLKHEEMVPGFPDFPGWGAKYVREYFECEAYKAELACLRRLSNDRLCNQFELAIRIQELLEYMSETLRNCEFTRLPPVV